MIGWLCKLLDKFFPPKCISFTCKKSELPASYPLFEGKFPERTWPAFKPLDRAKERAILSAADVRISEPRDIAPRDLGTIVEVDRSAPPLLDPIECRACAVVDADKFLGFMKRIRPMLPVFEQSDIASNVCSLGNRQLKIEWIALTDLGRTYLQVIARAVSAATLQTDRRLLEMKS